MLDVPTIGIFETPAHVNLRRAKLLPGFAEFEEHIARSQPGLVGVYWCRNAECARQINQEGCWRQDKIWREQKGTPSPDDIGNHGEPFAVFVIGRAEYV